MQPIIMDPTWALLTLILTAVIGLSLWLVMMIVLQSRSIEKKVKRIVCPVLFLFFMVWLFTLGDPHSSFNLESLYYRSINYLPETRFTKILKPQLNDKKAESSTNAPGVVLTNK